MILTDGREESKGGRTADVVKRLRGAGVSRDSSRSSAAFAGETPAHGRKGGVVSKSFRSQRGRNRPSAFSLVAHRRGIVSQPAALPSIISLRAIAIA
jgi:hypothetical protein